MSDFRNVLPVTADDFKGHVLQLFLRDVHQIEQGNYAWERFSFDGVDRSQIFDLAKHVSYLNWFFANYENIYLVYTRLEDEASRQLLVDLMRYRLSGHLHVRIDAKIRSLEESARKFRECFGGEPSNLASGGILGALMHYNQEWNGIHYEIDTVSGALIYLLVYGQYFFERGGVRIQPEAGDYVIDGGAFTGDSACVFSRAVGPQGHVYTFDPVQNHLDMVRLNASRTGYGNITVFGYGLSDRAVEAEPIRLDQYHPGWRVDGQQAPLCRIDDLVIDDRIARIDYLKLDVEGSEMAALRGALAAIHRFRPKLAISVYHKPDDYFEIQEFIDRQNLGYRFYLDHYTFWDEETVLYAVCDRR